jgi:CO/xanthine dehydrogenase FAD-binding subunit
VFKTFEYFAPSSVEEAISLLGKYKGTGKLLAGGTDLLSSMRKSKVSASCLISLRNVSELHHLWSDANNQVLMIGSMTTLSGIVSSPLVQKDFRLIADAADVVGSVQVRNRGTIGGNICNASPAADTIPALLVLQSKVRITGPTRARVVPLEEFFVGPGATVLGDEEILTEIQVPLAPKGARMVYFKQGIRKAMDIAIVGVAMLIVVNSRVCEDIRIGLGSIAPTPIRALKAERTLRGKALHNLAIDSTAKAASDESNPISDIRASAEYRREIVKVLTERAIKYMIRGCYK